MSFAYLEGLIKFRNFQMNQRQSSSLNNIFLHLIIVHLQGYREATFNFGSPRANLYQSKNNNGHFTSR